MASTRVSIHIPAPPDVVWADISDVGSHVEWMADADSIVFVDDQHSGEGTRMDVATRVGPLRLTDRMEVTTWDPPRKMGIRHTGIVTGDGAFTLTAEDGGTAFVWAEQLTFPWYLGGPLTAAAAEPILARIWRHNLERLRARFA